MATTFQIPDAKAVQELLEIIFGDGLQVTACDAPDSDCAHVATYIDDDESLVALGHCDAPFVAYAGAALSMIPPDEARRMVDQNDITEAIFANHYEVMNICSRLLMDESGGAHLRLERTVNPGDGASPADPVPGAHRVGFKLDVPRYGTGMLAFSVS